jgi:hypothetical protein
MRICKVAVCLGKNKGETVSGTLSRQERRRNRKVAVCFGKRRRRNCIVAVCLGKKEGETVKWQSVSARKKEKL